MTDYSVLPATMYTQELPYAARTFGFSTGDIARQNALYFQGLSAYTGKDNSFFRSQDAKDALSNDNRLIIKALPEHRVEDINSVIQSLYGRLPENMALFLRIAASRDKEVFKTLSREAKNYEFPKPYYSMFCAPIDQIANISGIKASSLVNDIREVLGNHRYFLSYLTTFSFPDSSQALNKVMAYRYSALDEDNYWDREYFQDVMIARGLIDLDCCRTFIEEKSKLSPKKVELLSGGTIKKRNTREGRLSHEKVKENPDNEQMVLFMLMLYEMGCQIIQGISAFSVPFTRKYLSSKASVILAMGAYICARNLFKDEAVNRRFTPKLTDSLPSFRVFFKIVELYVEGKASIKICARCKSPTLVFDDEVSLEVHRGMKPGCPFCGSRDMHNTAHYDSGNSFRSYMNVIIPTLKHEVANYCC